MSRRVVLKAQRAGAAPARDTPWLRSPLGKAVTLLAGAPVLVLMGLGLTWWSLAMARTLNRRRVAPYFDKIRADFLARWQAPPPFPAFVRGQEPNVAQALERHPLLVAVAERQAPGRVWYRHGPHLAPLKGEDPGSAGIRNSLEKMAALDRSYFSPSRHEDPDSGKALLGLTRDDRFVYVSRLVPGSRALDEELRLLLGPEPQVQFRAANGWHESGTSPETPYQASRQTAAALDLPSAVILSEFSGWNLTCVPSGNLRRRLALDLVVQVAGTLLLGVLPFVALLGFWLVRRRTEARKDQARVRLATLIQEIRAPLLQIQQRCDQIQGKLTRPKEADQDLIIISEEVSFLSLMIANGLRASLGVVDPSPVQPVTRAWLASIAEEFQEEFEGAGRALKVSCQPGGALASLPHLRQVVQILLENALLHGAGTTSLEARNAGNRLLLTVADAGPGMDRAALQNIGKPFLRLHGMDPGTGPRPSLGMGLSLALQIAEREGWGMVFATAPGMGFAATLKVATPWGTGWRRAGAKGAGQGP